MGANPLIGEIQMFAGNFAPRGWAFCEGQLLAIASNTALFSILGTRYGGDGRTTFALPDLRGRLALGTGQSPGTTQRVLGEEGGAAAISLTIAQMPNHTHAVAGTCDFKIRAATAQGTVIVPTENVLPAAGFDHEVGGDLNNYTSTTPASPVNLGGVSAPVSSTCSNSGQSEPHSNEMPMLGMHYVIALYGIYPSRG